MDWTLALRHHHTMLHRLVAGLFLLAGIAEGGSAATMPRHRRLALLSILRPAESACRRVIVLAVYAWKVTARVGSVLAAEASRAKGAGVSSPKGLPAFRLTDPRKTFGSARAKSRQGAAPRITMFGMDGPVLPRGGDDDRQVAPALTEDDEVAADRVCARLNALKSALDDLPKQARRMARLDARIRACRFDRARVVKPAMRPGWPPGHRARQVHPVDDILAECHRLAMRAVHAPDTS